MSIIPEFANVFVYDKPSLSAIVVYRYYGLTLPQRLEDYILKEWLPGHWGRQGF